MRGAREPGPGAARVGILYGLAAYLTWGFGPVYFKAVAHVPAVEVLAHRIAWSLLLLAGYLLARGRGRDVVAALRDRATRRALALTTLLITVNWFVFIWAVAHGRVLQASLGYFVNPLVNVALGRIFLGERLRRRQGTAVLLAAVGVLFLTLRLGRLPLVSLVLAFSFAFYGLLRKTMRAGGTTGLTVETLLLLPPALGTLLLLELKGRLAFGHTGGGDVLLLAASGPVTALPLIWFANAARRLRYATVGFLQYLTPTLHFLLAVVAYGESFTRTHLLAFACIWTALGLYSWDVWRATRRLTPRAR
jgi:chloramphenicol-sensitive protein RarD